MQANQFFDESDVTTLLLMSTCVQDEMSELQSACIAYELSAEGITVSVDSVFDMDITIIVCQMSELENSLAALDRRIAQLEQARSRPEPYSVSEDDAVLISVLVSENATLEVDKTYARRLQEMENQGRRADGVDASQVLDENYKHMQEFEKMPLIYRIPNFKFLSTLIPKGSGGMSSQGEDLEGTVSMGTDILPPIQRKPHQMAGPAQVVWLMQMPNMRLPSGVFDMDKTLVEGDVLEIARSSSQVTVAIKGKGKGKAIDEVFLEEDELMVLGDDLPDDMTYHVDLGDGSSSSISRQRAKCGICFDDFRVTVDPYRSALSATSSVDKNKGLEMPCGHKYCLGCASQYLKTELEKQQPVCEWLISCPECPSNDPSRTRFTEQISQTILGAENMETWAHHALTHPTISTFEICKKELKGAPNSWNLRKAPKEKAQAPALVVWKLLPHEERMREDKLLFDLLEQQNWVRCPGCGVPSERISGCPHMTAAANTMSDLTFAKTGVTVGPTKSSGLLEWLDGERGPNDFIPRSKSRAPPSRQIGKRV
ncbi:hypothetical protein QFC21_000471 [Naganishia friedmannii]|uniref:Uncharacterized protein n=1 Tax=Naganishia friedmannii TaxID=89922 RepID=A0ACC2WCP4_9TREE|nr:hypothetical protein QFC21_000471 [Naganishia friedmannii]